MKEVTLYAAKKLADYGFGEAHPFGNDRLPAFWSEAVRRGIDRRVELADAPPASMDELRRFHTTAYLKKAQSLSDIGFGFLDQGDTPARKGIFEAATQVVGAGLDAVRSIMKGKTTRCFLPIAGLHHGRRSSAGGFCVLNDCGVMIETLKQEYGLRRIAYVDIDAHHGDGVFYSFEDDPAVVIADLHEDGRFLYPGTGNIDETGHGEAKGHTLNIPMPPGSGDRAFMEVWPLVLSHIESHKPEFILLQAGVDSIQGDPITHLEYTAEAHRLACRTLRSLAEQQAKGRLLVMGGGGYNLKNVAQTWCDVIETLLEP